jgi:hypothetical protein
LCSFEIFSSFKEETSFKMFFIHLYFFDLCIEMQK